VPCHPVGAVRDQVFGVDAVGSADEHFAAGADGRDPGIRAQPPFGLRLSARIEFVAELPKTLTGKIRRIELRQLELQRSRQTVF
jgi:hypothetical protein